MRYSSNYWLTWKQCEELKGSVKPEERTNYQIVIFWKMFSGEQKNDNGEMEKRNSWVLRYYRVYNTEQCVFPDKVQAKIDAELASNKKAANANHVIDKAKAIVDGYDKAPTISHGHDKAFYIPMYDAVNIPEMEQFDSSEEYYSTLFHELGHSTGHVNRLKRQGIVGKSVFGDKDYSREELIAEMTALFLCGHSGIENKTVDNSAAYISNWRKKLSEDKQIVVMAAAQAQKAADWILGKRYDKVDSPKTEEEAA
jgi:antirestriction protein ArdC